MPYYRVVWEIDIDVDGDHLAAAEACALAYFKPEIAAGQPGSACVFEVTGPVDGPAVIDLAPSLSELEGDDTQ